MIEAKFSTRLTPEEAYEKFSKTKKWKLTQDPTTFQVMIRFHSPIEGKVQVSSSGTVLVWCKETHALNCIRSLLNEVLGSEEDPEPLGKPVYVVEFARRQVYFETPKETLERLSSDPMAISVLSLDRELNNYPVGDPEKARILGLHLASFARIWGPETLKALKEAVSVQSFRKGVKILVRATALRSIDEVSYFYWLLMEHKDVALQAWSYAYIILADLLNRDVAVHDYPIKNLHYPPQNGEA